MAKTNKSCPGQDTAYLKDFNTNIMPCPKCGHEIEFFSGERKVRCTKCHNNVFNLNPDIINYKNGSLNFEPGERSCIDWCSGCLDKKDYKDIENNNKRIELKKEDLKKLIDSVDKKDIDIIQFFIEAFRKSINHPKLIDEKIFNIIQRENPALFLKARNYYLNFLNKL